jgi:hypothetical protein
VSEKAQLGDIYWRHYQDLDARLADPEIDNRTLKSLTREAVGIVHKYSELMGWLPTRAQVDLSGDQAFRVEVVGVDMERALSGLSDDQPAARASVPPPDR